MSIHKQKKNDCQYKESISAFLDAEQSDIETAQTIDALLNDSEYKEYYMRSQLINEYLQDQVQTSVLNTELRNNISLALDDLPGHFVDNAVSLQSIKTQDISHTNWFKRFTENRMLSGVSIAASVMFMTLFTLQGFNSESSITNSAADSSLAATTQISPSPPDQQPLITSVPSLIQSASELPASYVSAGKVSTGTFSLQTLQPGNNNLKPKYQWIEADPVLSQHVRKYVNEHETHRAAYNLQPQIRTATYQISD